MSQPRSHSAPFYIDQNSREYHRVSKASDRLLPIVGEAKIEQVYGSTSSETYAGLLSSQAARTNSKNPNNPS
jgi:hypothetical protein